MSQQLPMISIPKKTTEEADWTTPIRNLIAKSYGESPDNYVEECQALQCCRQDAVQGAGSEVTGRDLLYKYFGQLELLELRFSDIRVNFSWHDAFTNKVTAQTSIAFEKASVLFQIAATHSAIAAAQTRFEPEGTKLAFYYFRACAGMLTYINENFLHAPSTDLSSEVIKFLVGVILAQATEVFLEKCINEKKTAVAAKVASQTASMYGSSSEEVKDFQGKGIFDRNWVTLLQIKSKLFASLAQFYRAQVDSKASNHGDALARLILAESLAKEAHRSAVSFSSLYSHVSSTLPADAGFSILERTKSHMLLCAERKNEAQRENDLIYNAVIPEVLPPIEKTSVASPVSIQDVFGSPDVQKMIGPDIFMKLIPLSVHESASVYSEEKAKLVRKEVENTESADVQVRSALEAIGVREGLGQFKVIARNGAEEDAIPPAAQRWIREVSAMEGGQGVKSLMQELIRLRDGVRSELENLSRRLEEESHECETMRIKYDHLWTQDPSAGFNKSLRQDLKSHTEALDAAASSDNKVISIWNSIRTDIELLLSPEAEEVFRVSTEPAVPSQSLLDLDVGGHEQGRSGIVQLVSRIEEGLGQLKTISFERNRILKELKEKVQADDVSHLLLLNRRNTGVEPTLFAAELEKFKPYQRQLNATMSDDQALLKEIGQLWRSLRDLASRDPEVKKWQEGEKRKNEVVSRFSRARDGYMDVHDGLTKGLQFYHQLMELTSSLVRNVKSFVSSRRAERMKLVGEVEVQRRLSVPKPPLPPADTKPLLPPPPPPSSLETSFRSMDLQGNRPRVLPQQSSPPYPPPPPKFLGAQSSQDPYESLGFFGSSRGGLPALPPQSPPPPGPKFTLPPPPPLPPSQYQPFPPPPPQGSGGQFYQGYRR